jgi:transposase
MGGKRIIGRTRQTLVDTNGLLVRVLVHTADISDTDGGIWMSANQRAAVPRLTTIRVDQGDKDGLVQAAATDDQLAIDVVTQPADQVGFAVIPKRWGVERTFAWLGRNRRLSKDHESVPECSEAWIYLASIHLMLKRLTRG